MSNVEEKSLALLIMEDIQIKENTIFQFINRIRCFKIRYQVPGEYRYSHIEVAPLPKNINKTLPVQSPLTHSLLGPYVY